MLEVVTTYLVELSTKLALPVAIGLIAAAQIFTALRGFTYENYQHKVEEKLASTLIDKISELLTVLFPEYGLTPARSAPFPAVLEKLLTTVSQDQRLEFLTNIYTSLVETGIDSTFFPSIVKAFCSIMSGGGGPA